MVSVETTDGLERRMRVEVPAERIDGEVDKRLQEVGRRAKLRGFRPGKVPMKVVRQQYGPQVRQEVLSEIVQSSWFEAVREKNLRPVGGPRIETEKGGQGEGLAFTATFEVFPEIALSGAEGIAVERPVAEITPADVDDMIGKLRRQRSHWHAVERAAGEGDRVVVDFEGSIDGEPFAGGSGKDVPVVLGEGRMLEDFEKGLTGIAAGESRDVTVQFPKDYASRDVAGRKASFHITAQRVDEEHLPELDDEFCKLFGITEGGMEKLRAEVELNMRQEMAERVHEQMKRQVLDGLLAANDVELPSGLVEQEIQSLREDAVRRMGGQVDERTTLPPREPFEELARRRVALGLLIGEVVRTAEMKIDTAKVRARLEAIAAAYSNPEQIVKLYTGNRELMSQVETSVLEDQVVEWLLERARVNEKPVAFDALMQPA